MLLLHDKKCAGTNELEIAQNISECDDFLQACDFLIQSIFHHSVKQGSIPVSSLQFMDHNGYTGNCSTSEVSSAPPMDFLTSRVTLLLLFPQIFSAAFFLMQFDTLISNIESLLKIREKWHSRAFEVNFGSFCYAVRTSVS